ncbi:hypothetical protein ALI144C_41555 [Actinosynnema sp. ALI-1.44]|uniref:hypothetical protein n=1 Tax=Actinosynnema sp. ALI-1.44 TaxID=1933779 RepID=UPI00097C88D8|nr:hypothetical protein [Actinosynnema sp. ALI-1.44]ONI75225.1 hypothetical protein ALI144C_41555 [Actinosynnema sp. ALI-1.44]
MKEASPFWIALIASVSVLAIVLATDLGHRALTRWRLARSLLAVVIVCGIFVRSLPTGGNDVPLQLAGIGAGVLAGVVAAKFLVVERASDGRVMTRGGFGYAAVWVVLSAARVVFAYGAEHWFAEDIVMFSIEHGISGQDTYANAFLFMALAMVLARSGVLLVRTRRTTPVDVSA